MAHKAFVIGLLGAIATLIGVVPASAGVNDIRPDSSCWQYVRSPNGTNTLPNALDGVDGTSANDVWAVGGYESPGFLGNEALIEHWDGTSWRVSAAFFISGSTSLGAVDAIAPDDVWAVGYYNTSQPLIEHWDGTGWFLSGTPVPGIVNIMFGVAAASPTDIWAVGQYQPNSFSATKTLILHWNGTAWTQVPSPSPGATANQLNDVAVVSSGDVWAVGISLDADGMGHTLTEHWNGTRWSVVRSPTGEQTALEGVTAIASNDVWAVGSGTSDFSGFSIHWDGSSWTEFPMPVAGVEDYVHGVSASSSTDVWAVGEASPNFESWQALALKWDGSKWALAHPPSGHHDAHFYGVADLAPGDAWAVGTGVHNGPSIDLTLTEHWTNC